MENNITVNMENLSQDERDILLGLIEKANKPKSKVWKPQNEEYYYCIHFDGTIDSYNWNGWNEDTYSIGNCFKTKEEAKFALEKQKVITELKRFALENNECEIDWNNSKQCKYQIYYDSYARKFEITFNTSLKSNNIYFSSREIAKKAIETIGEDRLKKYYFEIED